MNVSLNWLSRNNLLMDIELYPEKPKQATLVHLVQLLIIVDQESGHMYVSVRLTDLVNRALYEYCHTPAQREAWDFPCYPFFIREGSISVDPITFRKLRTGGWSWSSFVGFGQCHAGIRQRPEFQYRSTLFFSCMSGRRQPLISG
ncbi:uncharacterized protein BJX67DRAFT_12150 [Aspergillus lucknowensis]|uniref:Uncharacterized protein n=1 Tax=Aspergillus lucknowensis TaxID=176173 RepID=A0ABR4M7J6_9EURO